MEQDESFYTTINDLYAQFIAETNPQDKLIIQQKLIVEVYKNTLYKKEDSENDEEDTEICEEDNKTCEEDNENDKGEMDERLGSWGLHADIVAQTIVNCLSENSKYDSSKGEFSNYLLIAIKNNVNAEIKKQNNKTKKNTPLEQKNENEESYFITDIVEQSVDTPLHLTDIHIILTLDDIREDLHIIDNLLKEEKNNREQKATIITRDILDKLHNEAFELLDSPELYGYINEMRCLDKKLWQDYFYNLEDLPSRVMLAARMEIPKKRADQWAHRFKVALKEKKSLQIVAEG